MVLNLFEVSHPDYLSVFTESEYNPTHAQFSLLSTIRYDPNLTPQHPPTTPLEITKHNFFLLDEHYQRLVFALRYFRLHMLPHTEGLDAFAVPFDYLVQCLVESIARSDMPVYKPMKVRLLVLQGGELRIELHDTSARPNLYDALDPAAPDLCVWDVRRDRQCTLASPFTSFKTTNRAVYTAARSRGIPGLRPGCEEVLLMNQQEQLMEGSITNVAIRSGDEWITPVLSSGCLCGVMRNHLVHEGYIREAQIAMLALSVGDEVLLFNAVMGVVRGIVVD